MTESGPLFFAFGLTLLAGLSTGIGGLLGIMAKTTHTRFLTGSLGFSAGVMLYVSFVEILAKARISLTDATGSNVQGAWLTAAGFFGGIALSALIDKFVPESANPHEPVSEAELGGHQDRKKPLLRMGLVTALAIGIHNFPEGLATFLAALKDPSLGIPIAIAIAIHNIPEGIAVSVPVYFATGSRRKAFLLSLTSGFAEPVGALVGYFILKSFFNEYMFGTIFAGVAGVMVFISLDELLPTAEKYGEHHVAIYGVVSGMALMAVSLLLFVR